MENIIFTITSFITFLSLKYLTTFLYKSRYLSVIIIDSLIVTFYIVSIALLEKYINDAKPDAIRILLFFFIIPSIYAFIKPKILRKYYNWEVWMYYPITEFLVISIGFLISVYMAVFIKNLLF